MLEGTPSAASPSPPGGSRAQSLLPLGLGALALLLPAWSPQQALLALSFGACLMVFALWGGICARSVLGIGGLRLWTSVYLGQFTVLAAAAAAMPLNALVARWLGKSVPLPALVLAPTVVLAALRLRQPLRPMRLDLLALSGLGCMAVVLAIYSRHLSALSLDVHEHLGWIRQVVARGYLPIAEPDTRIVGDYPRTFHLLAGLWNAAGFGVPAGPVAKLMPFLQNGLPLLALSELLADEAARRGSIARRRWEITLGVAFFAHAFLLVPLAYPTNGLFGTPRFSSNGLLLLPLVLVTLAHVRQAPRASAAALTTAPLLAAWALTWNPIVIVLLAAVTAPVLAAFWAALRPPRARELSPRSRRATLAVCSGLALLVLAQDPWVVGQAAEKIPVFRALVHRAGLITFAEAVAAGEATAREKPIRNLPSTPACDSVDCKLGKAAVAARSAVTAPLHSAVSAATDLKTIALSRSLPALKDAFKGAFFLPTAWPADYAGLPLFLWIAAAALLAVRESIRQRRTGGDAFLARLLIASLVGLAGAGMGLAFATELAAGLNDGRHEWQLLVGYLALSGAHVSLAFLWLPFASATGLVLDPVLRRAAVPATRGVWVTACGLAFWLTLPLSARLNLHQPIRHEGFWTPIGLEDLRALRRIEDAIPPGDGVIVPAEHARFGGWENWVLPRGETTALLPYGERKYLFNVYLGASYPLSWRDLEERLCSKDPAVRAAFFARTRARWLLIRDRSGNDAATVARRPWPGSCGLSAAELGAEVPPAHEERGIRLFRLRGPSVDEPGSR